MGHGANAKEAAYMLLAERLNKNPVGTPINEELMEILHHLYTQSEAMAGGKFPMAPMKLEQIVSSIPPENKMEQLMRIAKEREKVLVQRSLVTPRLTLGRECSATN